MKKFIILLLACVLFVPSCKESTDGATDTVTTQNIETDSQTDDIKTQTYCVRTARQPEEEDLQTETFEFDDYDEACQFANDSLLAAKGYAVYDSDGNYIGGKNGEFVSAFLTEAKYVADVIKTRGYSYGSAGINPAISYERYMDGGRESGKSVSCDRFVGWALYSLGYKDQPIVSGLFVWAHPDSEYGLGTFLEKRGFEKITSSRNIEAGDVVFVNPTTSSSGEKIPAHVFICAGKTDDGLFYRYDAGSDNRIKCVNSFSQYSESGQPFSEPISNFVYAYRYVEGVSQLPEK